MITAGEIAARLAQQSEDVCRMLLMGGKRDGTEWRAGSVSGEHGKSLGVRLTGPKAGTWKDFAADGKGGDLLDLWAQAKNINLAEAMRETKVYLGISEPRFEGHTRRQYRRPSKPKCTRPDAEVLAYLTISRKLTRETINAYQVASRNREMVFPYTRDGELINVKYISIDRHKGGKPPYQESQCEPCLFGWQAITQNAREVFITEGEIDAMTMYQYGYPALSVPIGGGGGGKQLGWIESEFDRLARFDVIWLCMDDDTTGHAAIDEIINRIGAHRCRVVELPKKDANDCLKADITKSVIDECVKAAYTKDPSELRSAADYAEDVIREFYPPDNAIAGFCTPWIKLQKTLMFRPGEVTLIAGYTGHGKSAGVGHLTLHAVAHGARACVASMEFKPQRWLMRLARQASGVEEPSTPFIRQIHEWYRDRMWVFDVVGTAKHERMLEVFEYARRRYGITLFVIDNLTKLDIDLDDYNGQRRFIDKLTDFAKTFDVHVFLVAHTRKSHDDSKPGGRMDVKGSGALTDLVDTVLIWWRNRAKEESIRNEGVNDLISRKPDAIVTCEKQRNGEDEPRVMLWFNRRSGQFTESHNAQLIRYVEFTPPPGRDG